MLIALAQRRRPELIEELHRTDAALARVAERGKRDREEAATLIANRHRLTVELRATADPRLAQARECIEQEIVHLAPGNDVDARLRRSARIGLLDQALREIDAAELGAMPSEAIGELLRALSVTES